MFLFNDYPSGSTRRHSVVLPYVLCCIVVHLQKKCWCGPPRRIWYHASGLGYSKERARAVINPSYLWVDNSRSQSLYDLAIAGQHISDRISWEHTACCTYCISRTDTNNLPATDLGWFGPISAKHKPFSIDCYQYCSSSVNNRNNLLCLDNETRKVNSTPNTSRIDFAES